MPIISVKAGRCSRRAETNWVDPQPAKGKIEIEQNDGLLTFHWRSREAGGQAENDELIIFPGDCTFEKVDSDRSGRTHVLKFSSSDKRDFFWFQNASDSRDETAAFNINSILQDPDFMPVPYLDDPAPNPSLAAAAGASLSSAPPQTPAQNTASTSLNPSMPEAPNPQRVAHLNEGQSLDDVRGAVMATPAPASSSAPTQGGSQPEAQFSEQQIGALARLLRQSVAGSSAAARVQEDAHLTDILTPANLLPILTSSPAFIHSLVPHLPTDLPISSPPTQSEIQSIISSPQWTEAVAGLDAALRTGALVGSMGSLGLTERAGQGVGEFLEEVVAQGKREEEQEGGDRMDTD